MFGSASRGTLLLPKATPDYTGKMGKAWRANSEAIRQKYPNPADSTLAMWFIWAPYAHPLWHSYVLSVIHLRDIPGTPPAKIMLSGAQHEVILGALDPDHAYVLDDVPRYLTPMNFQAQFIEPTDEAAVARCWTAVKDVCEGTLNPDTDYAQWWIRRFSASNIKGDPARAGETVITGPGGSVTIPPVPAPKD